MGVPLEMVVLLSHLDSFSLPVRRQGGAMKRLDLSMHNKCGLSFTAWRWKLSWACRVPRTNNSE